MQVDFKRATDFLMQRGVTVEDIAFAARVSTNSILRARMETGQRRSPPKEWPAILRRVAEEQAFRLNSQASDLAAFAMELTDL